MLRKVRREGLSPEQLATLGSSSRLDDSEARQSESASASARPEGGVKAKIDEIEQQMVGGSVFAVGAPEFGLLQCARPSRRCWPVRGCRHRLQDVPLDAQREELPALPLLPDLDVAPVEVQAPVFASAGTAAVGTAVVGQLRATLASSSTASASRVSEVVHDPDLDEAVIAFANADFNQCEQSLLQLTRCRRRTGSACRNLAGAVRPVPRHRPAAALRGAGE